MSLVFIVYLSTDLDKQVYLDLLRKPMRPVIIQNMAYDYRKITNTSTMQLMSSLIANGTYKLCVISTRQQKDEKLQVFYGKM